MSIQQMENLDKKILVQLENVGVFQNNKWLVEDVSLNVEKGKILTQYCII